MKKRVISAIIMIIVFIPFLIVGGNFYLVLASVLGILSLWELMRLNKNVPSYMQFLSYIVCLLIILYKHDSREYFDMINFPIIVSLFLVYSFSVIINGNLKKYSYEDGLWLMGIAIMIGLMFNSLIKIRFLGLYEMLYCLLIATLTDTFALFGGKMLGKTKLCKETKSKLYSPVGSYSGTICGTLVGTIFYYQLIGNMPIGLIILLTFMLSIFGQFGDLFFSSIKRKYNIKDFSNIIPGHGGILDRLDSLLFIISGYLLYIMII